MLSARTQSHVPSPPVEIRFDRLSTPRQRLVRLLQLLGFGCVEELRIVGGQPVLDPCPKTIRGRKPHGQNTPRPQAAATEFVLKGEWSMLFDDIDAIGNGSIRRIDVMHGLPVYYEFEDVIAV